MKFEDIKVGQTIKFGIYTYNVILKTDEEFVVEYINNKTLHVQDKSAASNYEKVRDKIKVYTSVWGQKSPYIWSVTNIDKQQYDNLTTFYINSGHICLGEWVNEIDDPQSSN